MSNHYNNQINSLVNFETLAQEAYSSIQDAQAEKIAQNHNIVSSTLNSIVNIAKSLYDDGPLLSVNSTFLNEENVHAVEAVKHLHQASENMISAFQECNRLKETLEKRRTGVLANYEQEMKAINEEKEKAIKLAEEQIFAKTNQAKQTMLLSSSTACNLLLDPEHLALNFTRGDFNFINENCRSTNFLRPSLKKESIETSSVASSGFCDDDDEHNRVEDIYEHSMVRSRSSSRHNQVRQPQRKPSTTTVGTRNSRKTLENRVLASFPTKIQNEHFGRVVEQRPSTSFETEPSVVFNIDLFGSVDVDPLKITGIEKESPVLSTSLAATFILSNLKTIDKKSKLAEALYDTCRYQFINYETMYAHVAKKFGISSNTYIDTEIINFPIGISKMNTLINRFNDELNANQLFTDNKVYNNALVVANIFVHLAKFSTNAFYTRFLSETKVEPC